MKPKTVNFECEQDMFRHELRHLLDLRHALIKLSHQINWESFEKEFGALYPDGKGRPGIAIRLMVGLHYLKHMFNLSDEAVVERWVENPYYQYFCGEQYFQHRLPIDPSQMSRFRSRIGASGCETMLKLTIEAGLKSKTIDAKSVEVLNVDTTVQEKAIAFPTDGRLYYKARAALVRQAKECGLVLRQSYERLSKQALMMNGRYAHAKQMNQAKCEQKSLRTYLGRVIRDIERKLVEQPQCTERFSKLLNIAKRIHTQQRHDKDKIYSVHGDAMNALLCGAGHNLRKILKRLALFWLHFWASQRHSFNMTYAFFIPV